MPINKKPKSQEEAVVYSVLNGIDEITHSLGFIAFAVGGFCRDEYWGKEHTRESDIDLMAENYHGLYLAGAVAERFGVPVEYSHKTGTGKLSVNGLDIDCKANLKNFDLLPELRKTNLPQNNLSFDIISRDFTINTLIMSLRSGKIYDVLGTAKKDLDDGIIRCPVNADLSVKTNSIIALRALVFANRYDFTIDNELDAAIRKHREHILTEIDIDKASKTIEKILKPNPDNGKRLLQEYGFEQFII